MARTCVVTGSASGIGAATADLLRRQGCHVIGSDLHDADVVADLTTTYGRAALVRGVSRLAGGRIDAVVANAGGGPPWASLALNFFGTVATLEGLRPLLEKSPAPRAVAISSIASLGRTLTEIIERCLEMDEPGAMAAARTALEHDGGDTSTDGLAGCGHTPLALYATAKQALEQWCRRVAPTQEWAGMGITLNVVALGFYDTPAAAYVLSNPPLRASMATAVPLRGAFPGRPEEAAAVLAWCTSAESSQMTGQVLFADGGYEARLWKERARMSPDPQIPRRSPGYPREALKKLWAWVRSQGLHVIAEVGINFVLPYLVYVQAERAWGPMLAFTAASVPPMLWALLQLAHRRRLDAFSVLALIGIALSVLAYFGCGGVIFLQIRERLVTAAIGLIFLGSAAIGKPLIYQLAHARVRARPAAEANAFDAMRESPVFRRTMTIITLVWGTVLLAEAAVSVGLVFVLSIRQYWVVSSVLGYGTLGITTAWTYRYAYRRLRPLAQSLAKARAPTRPARCG